MKIKKQINQEIEKLPEPLLQEILDFIQFLQAKHQLPSNTEQITEKIESETHTQIQSPSSDLLEHQTLTDISQLAYRPASGRSILRHAGTWSGDDFQECLESVYASRGKAKFDYDFNPFE